ATGSTCPTSGNVNSVRNPPDKSISNVQNRLGETDISASDVRYACVSGGVLWSRLLNTGIMAFAPGKPSGHESDGTDGAACPPGLKNRLSISAAAAAHGSGSPTMYNARKVGRASTAGMYSGQFSIRAAASRTFWMAGRSNPTGSCGCSSTRSGTATPSVWGKVEQSPPNRTTNAATQPPLTCSHELSALR